MNIVAKTFLSLCPQEMSGVVREFLIENKVCIDDIEHFSIHPVGFDPHGEVLITATLIYRRLIVLQSREIADVTYANDTKSDTFDRGVMGVNHGCIRDGLVRRIHATCLVLSKDVCEMVYMVIAGVTVK